MSLCVGEEMFVPDMRLYRDKLVAAGIALDYFEEPGAVYDFPLLLAVEEGARATERQVEFCASTWSWTKLASQKVRSASRRRFLCGRAS